MSTRREIINIELTEWKPCLDEAVKRAIEKAEQGARILTNINSSKNNRISINSYYVQLITVRANIEKEYPGRTTFEYQFEATYNVDSVE